MDLPLAFQWKAVLPPQKRWRMERGKDGGYEKRMAWKKPNPFQEDWNDGLFAREFRKVVQNTAPVKHEGRDSNRNFNMYQRPENI